jgi:hypothetical protein
VNKRIASSEVGEMQRREITDDVLDDSKMIGDVVVGKG